MQLAQRRPVLRIALTHIDAALQAQGIEIQREGAEQALEQQTVQRIDVIGMQAANAGQLALIERPLVGRHAIGVLAEQAAHPADGADAETQVVAVAMQAVAAEVMVQRADLLGHGQVVMRQHELAQADVAVARRAQLLHPVPVHRQGVGRRREAEAADSGRHGVTVIEHGDLIGRELDDRSQLPGEARRGLPGATVAEVQVHRAIVQRMCRLDHRTDAGRAAEILHRAAIVGAQVRYRDAELVEAQLVQCTDQRPVDMGQLHLGQETAGMGFDEGEAALELVEQAAQRLDTEGADAQAQLFDRLQWPGVIAELLDLALEPLQVSRRGLGLQASAVRLTNGEGERPSAAATFAQGAQQVQRCDTVAEIDRSRIAAVQLPELSVTLYQGLVPGH